MKRVLLSLFAVMLALLVGVEETQGQAVQQFGARVGFDRVEFYNIYQYPVVLQYGYTLVPTWGPHTVTVPENSTYPIPFGAPPYDRIWLCALGSCVEFVPQNVHYFMEPFQLYSGFVSVFPAPVHPQPQPGPALQVFNPPTCELSGTLAVGPKAELAGEYGIMQDHLFSIHPHAGHPLPLLVNQEGQQLIIPQGDDEVAGKFDVMLVGRNWEVFGTVIHDGQIIEHSAPFELYYAGDWLMTAAPVAGQDACLLYVIAYDESEFGFTHLMRSLVSPTAPR